MPSVQRVLRKLHLWPKSRKSRSQAPTNPVRPPSTIIEHGISGMRTTTMANKVGNDANSDYQADINQVQNQGTGIMDAKILNNGGIAEAISASKANDNLAGDDGVDNRATNVANDSGVYDNKANDHGVRSRISDVGTTVGTSNHANNDLGTEIQQLTGEGQRGSLVASVGDDDAPLSATISASQLATDNSAMRKGQTSSLIRSEQDHLGLGSEGEAIIYTRPVVYRQPVEYHSTVRYLQSYEQRLNPRESPPSLATLPLELEYRIFEQLQSNTDDEYYQYDPHDLKYSPKDFYQLCLASKEFRAIAKRFLYRVIEPKSLRPKRLGFLVRTLVEKPKLARLVQKLFMPVTYSTCHAADTRFPHVPLPLRLTGKDFEGMVTLSNITVEEIMVYAKPLLDDDFQSLYEDFSIRLVEGEWSAFAGILLFLLPNIRRLDLLVGSADAFKLQNRFEGGRHNPREIDARISMAGIVLKAKAHSDQDRDWRQLLKGTLSSLNIIQVYKTLWYEPGFYDMELDFLLKLATINDLKSLQVREMGYCKPCGVNFNDSYPYWGVVKKLELPGVSFHPCFLPGILLACHGLESFCVRWNSSTMNERDYGVHDLELFNYPEEEDYHEWGLQLGEKLRLHSSTLHTLILDPEMNAKYDRGGDFPWQMPICDNIGSLRDFEQLEVLEIDDRMLCDLEERTDWGTERWRSYSLPKLRGFLPGKLRSFTFHVCLELTELDPLLTTIARNPPETLDHLCVNLAVWRNWQITPRKTLQLGASERTTWILSERDDVPFGWTHWLSTHDSIQNSQIIVRFEARGENIAEQILGRGPYRPD